MKTKNRIPNDLKSATTQFLRNACWGTCVCCPKDNDDNVIPELCKFFERYDHQLTLSDLIFKFKRWEDNLPTS